MKKLTTFLYAILAGVAIAMGGVAFLTIENKVVGAVFFTLGLFTVCTNGLNLFTGKVCYAFERGKAYVLDLPIIWLGNLVGAFLTGSLVRATRLVSLVERAQSVCATKLGDGLLSIFLLAIMCNICIFIAVDGYANNPHEFGKYLALFFGVTGFVICGYEHCVANMFYITAAGVWSWNALLYVVVMTLGNAVGGVIFPLLRKLWKKYQS